MEESPDRQEMVDEIGRKLITTAKGIRPSLRERATGLLIRLTLRDPKLRSHLLRFVCALPQTQDSPEALNQLARDLFLPVADRFPISVRPFLKQFLSTRFKRLSPLLTVGPKLFAQQFLGGTTDSELKSIIRRLKKQKIDVTVDNLGEFVTSEEGSERYFERAKRLIGLLERGSSVSLKATALTSDFDVYAPQYLLDRQGLLYRRFRELMSLCHERDLIGFVDAEHSENNRLMYQLQMGALDEIPRYKKAGFVVQAYLLESPDYLEEIIQWAKKRGLAHVRLVKGAYHEREVCFAEQRGYPIPVFLRQEETDTNFRRLTDRLLSCHEFIAPCIAGHNVREIAYAIARAKEIGILHKLEIQCLYGMAENLQKALVKMGIKVRAYVPHLTTLVASSDISGRVARGRAPTRAQRVSTGGRNPETGPAPEDIDAAEGIQYLGRRLIENGSISFQKIQIAKNSEPAQLLKLNDVSLQKENLATIESMPGEYQPIFPSSGFRPTAYLNPAEPERLERFWEEFNNAKKMLADDFAPYRAGPASGSAHRCSPAPLRRAPDPSHPPAQNQNHQLDQIIKNAIQAQGEWETLSVSRRSDILLKIAHEVEKRRDFLASIMILESKKPLPQADADIKECLDAIRYAAFDAIRKSGEGVFERYAPRGVAGIISPWNFPAAIPFIAVSNALASGSAAVLKPSELAPRIAIEIAEIFREIFKKENVNPDTLQLLLTDDPDLSRRFVSNERVRTIAFTGSKRVGLQIASGARGRSVTTEMGGTNAFVVGIDAEVDQTIANIRYGAFGYQGQKCSHIQNLFVPRPQLDLYLTRLREMADSCIVGPAHEPQTMIGPLIHERTQRHLDDILAETPPENIIYDGRQKWKSDNPCLVGPTILLNNERLLTEEFFGPLINVIPYSSDEEVMEKIGRSTYGLTFSIQTASPRVRSYYLKRNLETNTGVMAGNLYCEMPPVGAEIALNPFGGPGINLSGTGGKTGGPESMMTYLKPSDLTSRPPLLTKERGQGGEVSLPLDRLPADEEWQSLARKKGNDFRSVEPTELQYPGRTDLWERTPIGEGVIVVDPDMDESTLRRLIYIYLFTGNKITLLAEQSKQEFANNIISKLKGYGFSLGFQTSPPSFPLSLAKERGMGGEVWRWIHFRPGFDPGEKFYSMIHDPERSERQGFVTRVNNFPPWIDDPHLIAKTQVHRVISINTLHSGNIEKVEI